MAINVISQDGDFVAELNKADFKQKFGRTKEQLKKMRINKAENEMKERMIQEGKAALGNKQLTDKQGERNKIAQILLDGCKQQEIQIVATGKAGEFAIRMADNDYIVKITYKKERQEILK